MDINGTLLAQMVHFFIAYMILRWLLFKPAIAVIEADKDQKKLLYSSLESLEQAVVVGRQERNQLWDSFHHSTMPIVPSIMQPELHTFSGISSEIERHVLSDQERDVLIDACAAVIVEKVDHVRT